MQEGLRCPFNGSALTLGRQDIWLDFPRLGKIARQMKYPLARVDQVELSHKPEMGQEGFLSDRTLGLSLGFANWSSLDFSDYEKADFLFDLNGRNLPSHLENQFDVVIDGKNQFGKKKLKYTQKY
jgi:hypothetical protein